MKLRSIYLVGIATTNVGVSLNRTLIILDLTFATLQWRRMVAMVSQITSNSIFVQEFVDAGAKENIKPLLVLLEEFHQ